MGQIEDILKQVQQGILSVEAAKEQLASYEELGFAKVDHHRKSRQGFPEVIYGEGKTVEQIRAIIEGLEAKQSTILVTRVTDRQAEELITYYPHLIHRKEAGLLHSKVEMDACQKENGYLVVACAGTSDLRVAEEAAITAEVFGCEVRRIYDVGVAGLHRLLDNIEVIRGALVTIVVAGMDGALPSVVGGLVDHPVIAVPTSVGYGANFQGVSALLTMLNSCASGISVVNIDNGFGAAYNAALIYRLARRREVDDTSTK